VEGKAMATLHILLVEDQQGNIDAWNDRASAHNADAPTHGFSVYTVSAPSVAEAKRVLQTQKPDAIVVDLRLQVEGQMEPNDHGNALVRYALGAHPVAIAVYTGQRQEAEVADVPQVEVFDRGDGLDPVFDWLSRQHRMLLQLRATREAVERETARVFFRSIWPRWKNWAKGEGADIGGMLARHVVAHVHDALLDADGGAAHPEETYFMPAIKERLDTGDLIRNGDDLCIVVTPRCDLAHEGKVETVLVARCFDISKRWNEKPKEQSRMAQHDGSHKLHFLPPMLDHEGHQLGPWFVHFHDLKAVPVSQAPAELTAQRWASLAPQFVPSLVERFGAYFSRIGTPTLSSD
jgi:CheY-like chemotaxis protein